MRPAWEHPRPGSLTLRTLVPNPRFNLPTSVIEPLGSAEVSKCESSPLRGNVAALCTNNGISRELGVASAASHHFQGAGSWDLAWSGHPRERCERGSGKACTLGTGLCGEGAGFSREPSADRRPAQRPRKIIIYYKNYRN